MKVLQQQPAARLNATHISPLDGVRATAAMLVVLSHLNLIGIASLPIPTGSFGVMIFFILSGFLMAFLYLNRDFTLFNFINYISARAGRIAPLYLLSICFSYCLSLALGKSFVNYIELGSFLRLILFAGSNYSYWSIPPEVQFYLIFGLIWLLYRIKSVSLFYGAIGIFIFLLITRPAYPGISVFPYIHLFTIGCVAGFLRLNTGQPPRIVLTFSQIIIILLSISVICSWPDSLRFIPLWSPSTDVYGYIPSGLFFAFAVYTLSFDTLISRNLIGNRIFILIGKCSFFIYLFHEVVLYYMFLFFNKFGMPYFISLSFSLFTLLIIANISLHFYEKPCKKSVEYMFDRISIWLQSSSDKSSKGF